MIKFLQFLIFSLLCAVSLFGQASSGPGAQSAGSGSSSSSTGPVINVTNPAYAGCPAAANADWATCFASATAAANTAAFNPLGGITQKQNCSAATASGTTLNCTISGGGSSNGDATLVLIVNSHISRTFTVTDSGGSTYIPLMLLQVQGSAVVTLWGSIPQTNKASTSVTVVNSGAAEIFSIGVVTYGNVGGYDNLGRFATAANTSAPSNALNIRNNNDWIVSLFGFYSGGATTASANVGNLRVNVSAGVTQEGIAIVDNTAASMGTSVTTSATLSGNSAWLGSTIELLSGTPTFPTLYIPSGQYTYSSGLNPAFPMQIACGSNAMLNYTGSAHAVDLGPTGLTGPTAQEPYVVDNCGFTGGANMTYGIYWNSYVIRGGLRNNYFLNFGNATSYMVGMASSQWDIEVGPQNRVMIDDFQPRKVMLTNVLGIDNNTFVRFHDNTLWCIQGHVAVGLCTQAQSAVALTLDGAQNRVYHNNSMGWTTLVRFICTNGSCYGNHAIDNQIEAASDGGVPIQFGSTQIGTQVSYNVWNAHGSASSLVGPVAGTDVLTGARVAFNTLINFPSANPVVSQNNVAAQGGNTSLANNCSIGLTPMLACVLMHTAGASITGWSTTSDDQMSSASYATLTNCTSSASPAVCGSSAAGSFVLPAAATTVTVNTTAVTANSQIIVVNDDSLGPRLGVTCNVALDQVFVSARVAGTSFTITGTAPVTNPNCYSYSIVN